MAQSSRPLRESRSVQLNGSGAGSLIFGPGQPNSQWHISSVTVTVSSNTLEPAANVYHGTANAGTRISGTFSGSNDTDPDLDEFLWPGEFLTVVWTGGDAGATATAAFRGEILTGDPS